MELLLPCLALFLARAAFNVWMFMSLKLCSISIWSITNTATDGADLLLWLIENQFHSPTTKIQRILWSLLILLVLAYLWRTDEAVSAEQLFLYWAGTTPATNAWKPVIHEVQGSFQTCPASKSRGGPSLIWLNIKVNTVFNSQAQTYTWSPWKAPLKLISSLRRGLLPTVRVVTQLLWKTLLHNPLKNVCIVSMWLWCRWGSVRCDSLGRRSEADRRRLTCSILKMCWLK